MSASIDKLHDKARRAVQAGEYKFRQAAEYLAKAQKLGATQRQSAKAIGKSPAWVNALLKWKAAGYKDTPFGPQSKAKRASVQAPKQKAISPRPITAEQALAVSAKAEAQRAKAEATKAQAEFQKVRAMAVAKMFGAETKRIPNGARNELIRALRTLGSEHPAERVRARLNLTWHDLIVPPEVESEVSEAA
jgi:hypothetical protein